MRRVIVLIVALIVTIPTILKSRQSVHYVTPPAFSVYTSSGTMVMIDGDVRHPGIYVMGANIMTDSAIALAEPTHSLEINRVKAVARLPLSNGSALHVAKNANNSLTITVGSIPTAQRMTLGIPLDIQTMNKDDFDRLPGIGPVLADRIIQYRQNNGGKLKLEDLLSVSGIGEKKYIALKKFF